MYGMLIRATVYDKIVTDMVVAKQDQKAIDAAKAKYQEQTGLNAAEQAVFFRYAKQFQESNLAMFRDRGSSVDKVAAKKTELDFHAAMKIHIAKLQAELTMAGWTKLMASPLRKEIASK